MTGSAASFPDHEEGEPERISEPDDPLSLETVEKLREQGIELPDWKPNIPSAANRPADTKKVSMDHSPGDELPGAQAGTASQVPGSNRASAAKLVCLVRGHRWLNSNGGALIVCTDPPRAKCYRCGKERA